tara:strand:- start:259 stop:429 length:171 start_codon:yes stop_codon:yes gene_type:complete
MRELLDYQRHQINALQKEVANLRIENTSVKQYALELSDNDCPSGYKRVVSTLIQQM